MYAESDDPWGFRTRWYERRKYALTLAALSRPRYARALEIGCSIGVLSEQLALCCDELRCIDISPRAVDLARRRLAAFDSAHVDVGDLNQRWPAGGFDLIVLSEVLYYLDDAGMRRAVDRLRESLTAHGEIIAVHWRRRVPEYPSDGDAVHRALRDAGLQRRATYLDRDFRLEVLGWHPVPSVATADGLVDGEVRG